MPEIRWILLALGVLLIAGIWWWGTRKSHARVERSRADAGANSAGAPGATTAPLASPPLASTAVHAARQAPQREVRSAVLEPLKISSDDAPHADTDFDIPVMANDDFEPPSRSNINTYASHSIDEDRGPPVLTQRVKPAAQTAESVQPQMHSAEVGATAPDPMQTQPMAPAAAAPAAAPAPPPPPIPTASPPPSLAQTASTPAVAAPAIPAQPAVAPAPRAANVRTDVSGRFSRVPPPPKPVERQKIVGLRICSPVESPWPGDELAQQFAALHLEHGRYGVFHRLNGEARSIFCVASLIEPGTFDPSRMAGMEFGGVTLFAVLPGPAEGVETFNEMMSASRHLIESLGGMMQDDRASPLSPQRIGAIREEIVQFERQLGAQRQG